MKNKGVCFPLVATWRLTFIFPLKKSTIKNLDQVLSIQYAPSMYTI